MDQKHITLKRVNSSYCFLFRTMLGFLAVQSEHGNLFAQCGINGVRKLKATLSKKIAKTGFLYSLTIVQVHSKVHADPFTFIL